MSSISDVAGSATISNIVFTSEFISGCDGASVSEYTSGSFTGSKGALVSKLDSVSGISISGFVSGSGCSDLWVIVILLVNPDGSGTNRITRSFFESTLCAFMVKLVLINN